MNDDELRERLERIEQKIRNPPGHFWLLILVLAIAMKTKACF